MMRMALAIIVTVGIALISSGAPVRAELTLADGRVHNIDYEVNGRVQVDYLAPGMGTTLNWLEGGSIVNERLVGWEDSIINIFGGDLTTVLTFDNSQISVSGGHISHFFSCHGRSQGTFSGGSIGRSLSADYWSRVIVSGGSIGDDIRASEHGQIEVSGGLLQGDLEPQDYSVIVVNGSNFAVDGTTFGYGELTSTKGGRFHLEPLRHLTGILSNGDPLDTDFRIGDNAKIVLIPEPATLLLLGLGGLFLRRRR